MNSRKDKQMNAIARTTSVAGLVTLNTPNGALEAHAAEGGFFGRDGKVFIVEHSHSDIAWDHSVAGEAQVRNGNLEAVFRQMRKDPNFKWTIECVLFLRNWLDQHPNTEEEVVEWLRSGRLDCGATYSQPFENCLYDELLARQMYAGKRWWEKRHPDIELPTVLNQDTPARGLQAQQVYAKAGVKYLKGSRMNTPGFFRWLSPDGSGLLAWFQPGYWGRPLIDAAYLEQQMTAQAAFYRSNRLPPVLGLTWGHDYNDPVDVSAVIEAWNREAAAQGRPPVAYGTFADVLREVERRGAALPEVRGDVPNWWLFEHWPSHTRALRLQREAAQTLPLAETFHSVKALLAGHFGDYPAQALEEAWTDASYACHTMVPAPAPAPDAAMLEKYRKAADTGRRETLAALDWIAQRVETPRAGAPLVVFNGLSWPRTDPVEVALPENLAGPVRVTDAEGRTVPSQMLGNRRLVFVAEQVPAIGYKTFSLRAETVESRAAEPAVGSKWTGPFETDHYRAMPAPGGLASLLDKELNQEVFATNRWRGGEWVTFRTEAMGACEGIDFDPHPEVFLDRAADHKPEWTCVESGPVLVRWAQDGVKSRHCAAQVFVTFYRHLKRVDWLVQVTGNDDQIQVEQRLLFPLRPVKPAIAYEVPFGVVEAGKSEPFVFVNKGVFAPPSALPSHPREVQNWVNASGEGLGVTIGSSVGAWAFRDFGPGAEADRAVAAPILLACIANPQRKPYRQTGDFEFRFSLTTHAPGFQAGSRMGVQSQNPMWAVLPGPRASGPVKLPASCGFFAVHPASAAFSAIKKAEDTADLVLRVHDLDGVPADVRVRSIFRMQDARLTDLLERDGRPLPAHADGVAARLKAWGIETVKVRISKEK